MNTATIKKHALIFKNARNNLLLVVAFTAINLLSIAFNFDISFLFSASVPQLIIWFCQALGEELQSNAYMIAGFIIALLITITYLICWFLAERMRSFILVALVLFSIDTLVLLLLILTAGFDFSYLLDIAFHVWILYYLINGVRAWSNLRGVSADVINAALQGIDITAPENQFHNDSFNYQTDTDMLNQDEIENVGNINKGESPLRADDKKGRILIEANYQGLQISMKRTKGLTELIINGYVYDEIEGISESEYSLVANVHNIKIVGMYKSTRSHMYLYANDELIAKKLRVI